MVLMTRRSLYVFAFAVCLVMENVAVVGQTPSRTPLTTPQIAEQVTPAVVSIVGANGFGSGVVVDGAGVIVTNLHVVQGETALSIELNNGDVYDDVGVVDVDERRDIALLKIKAFNLPAAILGDSDEVRVGESVVLVGSPEGLDFTVSEGVISALRDSGDGYQMIQTSAPASPGSSGGGMFNEFGELIAIVTSQFTDGQNLNFALPINYVRGRLSTETTMSLEELAIRTGDARVTPDEDRGPEAEELNPEDIQRLREVMADVGYPSAESEDVLGRWILSIPDGEYLDPIPVTVELFLNGLVLIRGWTADPVTELSSGQLMKMLELNWDYNYTKVSFDSDGSVWAHAEIPLRILDAAAVDSLVLGVALATDRLTGIIEGRDDEITSNDESGHDITSLGADRGPGNSEEISYLDGHIRLQYDPIEWTVDNEMSDNPDAASQLRYFNNEAFAMIIPERVEVPLESLREIALQNLESESTEVTVIGRGEVVSRGKQLLTMDVTATLELYRTFMRSYYYSDSSGSFQLICWTSENLGQEYVTVFDRFAAGLRIGP